MQSIYKREDNSVIALYSHGGSMNHGCEAIIRSTYKILNTNMTLFSMNKDEDYRYDIQKIFNIISDQDIIPHKPSSKYYISALETKLFHSTRLLTKFRRNTLFSAAQKGDIFISVGGDNYCYGGQEVLGDINYWLHKKGAKTILWGCSIEPDILDEEIITDLKRYDAITVRESISFDALQSAGLCNITLCADPAFQLNKKEVNLPKKFTDTPIIGINISPLILEYGNGSLIVKNYEKLIEYILENTDYSIMLIPHVVTPKSDDRVAIGPLYEKYKETGKVFVVGDCNCEELKGYISKCNFFIGARTHSIIAAYSSMVPTLAVGYSVKAKGIAKDIFGEYEPYVIASQNMEKNNDLLNKMLNIIENEKKIRNHLQAVMPSYKEKAYEGLKYIENLI